MNGSKALQVCYGHCFVLITCHCELSGINTAIRQKHHLYKCLSISRSNCGKNCLAQGGAVAEWSKAILLREKINENPKKIPGSPPGLGNLYTRIA